MIRKISLFLFLCIFSAPFAAGGTSMEVKDINIKKTGDTFVLTLTIQGAEEIAGGSLKLAFNPEIISVQSVTQGDFGAPTYNVNSGSVAISVAGANAAGKASATLAVVTFKGEKEGSTALNLENVDLNKEDGSLVSPSTRNGIVTVGGGNQVAQTSIATQTPLATPRLTQTPLATAMKIQQNASSLKNQLPSSAKNDTVNIGTETGKSANPKLDQTLNQLVTSKNPQELAVQKGINMSGEKVRVVIMLVEGADIPGRFNIIIEQRDKNLIQALVPVNSLLDLAGEPGVSYIKLPENYRPASGIQPRQVNFPTIFSWVAILVIILLQRKNKNGKKGIS